LIVDAIKTSKRYLAYILLLATYISFLYQTIAIYAKTVNKT